MPFLEQVDVLRQHNAGLHDVKVVQHFRIGLDQAGRQEVRLLLVDGPMPLLARQQQALGEMREVFVQAAHLVTSGHELTLRVHQHQNWRFTALRHHAQHLLRQRQHPGGP